MRRLGSAVVFLLVALTASAQQDQDIHAQHHQEMNARGEKAMGFSQTATAHHFILLSDGGYVQVTANDAADTKSIDAIREHLAHIQKSFAAGDFSAPELTHGKVPPGTEVMRNAKDQIHYTVEEIKGGARLRIASANSQAVQAIYAFLRFQIEEHKTGDPTSVTREERDKKATPTTPEEKWLYPAQRVSADLESQSSRLNHDLHAVALTTLGSYWWKLDRPAAEHWIYPAVDEITIVPQEESDSERSARLEAARRVLAIVTPLDPILRERLKDVVTAAAPREGNAGSGATRLQTSDALVLSAWDAPPAELARAISEGLQYGVTAWAVAAIVRLAQQEPSVGQRLFDRALSQATSDPSEVHAFESILRLPADADVPEGWRETVISSSASALGALDPSGRCSLATMLGETARLADRSIPQPVAAALSGCMTGGADAAADAQTIQRDAPQTSDEYTNVAGELKTPSARYDMKVTASEKAEKEVANDGPVKALRILDGMTPEERAVHPGEYKSRRSDVAVRASLWTMGSGSCAAGLRVVDTSPRETILHVAIGVAEKLKGPCLRESMDSVMRQVERVPAEDPNDYVRAINLVVKSGGEATRNLQTVLHAMDTWKERDPGTVLRGEAVLAAPWNRLYPMAIAQELFNVEPEMLRAIARGYFRNDLLRIDFEVLLVRGFLDQYARDVEKQKQEIKAEVENP